MKRLVLLFCVFAAACSSALAGTPIRATLTSKVPVRQVAPGDHVRVTWTLHDAAGHQVVLQHVTLLIICPTRDAFTKTVATPRADGTYRVSAVVPPGGIGTLMISANKQTIRITNPIHR